MPWTNGEWYDDGTAPYVRDWCPECDPDGVSEPYTLRLCGVHCPYPEGDLDRDVNRRAGGSYWASSSVESDGEHNARWCRMIHGGNITST